MQIAPGLRLPYARAAPVSAITEFKQNELKAWVS
jgi:hypothetical protein